MKWSKLNKLSLLPEYGFKFLNTLCLSLKNKIMFLKRGGFMVIKWSKRIAVEYIQQMKSPIEEMSLPTNQPQSPLDRLRMAAQKAKNIMGIPQREM